MEKKIIILLAHPEMEKSVANRALMKELEPIKQVEVIDLYQCPYRPFDKAFYATKLSEASALVFQFPLYWASAPSELKRWIDEVFTDIIEQPVVMGKPLLVITTAGSDASTYRTGGRNHYTIDEMLRPFEAITFYSGMVWHTPIAIFGLSGPDAYKNLQQGIKEYHSWIVNHLNS